ncbi:MAG: hypothetical protein EOP84_07100 [Verrucomicrobiaceae bacterium]|nr:MAG: hypothetical protein EOP84_07100 [Verrucomicrobiaceae bacterium]
MPTCVKRWNSARAAIFWNPTDEDIKVLATGGLRDALAHGVLVRIVVPFSELRRRLGQLRHVPLLGTGWQLLVESRAGTVAEAIARHHPGPAQDSRVELRGDNNFSEEDRVLLQRAFHDCTYVHLERMPDGTSDVYIAHAKLGGSRVGPFPLPLFVKIDKRSRAKRERDHYGECTTSFIPFYARPNLHLHRCLMGAYRGIIVGDFVERSESLLELVTRGDAQSAINSLFQDALRGWRAQSYEDKEALAENVLYKNCLPHEVLDRKRSLLDEYSAIATTLGSSLNATEVARRLDALPPIRHRRGFTHGDLHCANVRARAGEAILIDFHSVGPGALSTDPATLEVSLCLEFMAPEAQWLAAMNELYSMENLRTAPRPREPTTPLKPLWEAVRQIRHYGLAEQVTDYEYCRAVAIQLIRKVAHRRNSSEQLKRRPYFIKLAAAIVLMLEGRSRANELNILATG